MRARPVMSVFKSGGGLDEYRIDALLLNWSTWARGGVAGIGYALLGESTEPTTPNDALAERVESVMVEMRRYAPGLWRAIRLRYVSRVTDITASRACGLDVDSFQARILSAYAWFADRWVDAN